jgi:branched-chain amino acid transport system substrate-binding protein
MKAMTCQRIGIAVAIAACVAMSAPAVSTADTIRIGAILSLTGNTAATGQSIRDGILLAVDEINKRGGVNGNKIDIAVEDNRSDPQTAVEAFNSMEHYRPPLFYLTFTSNIGIALAPLAEEKKVVLVGLATAALAFTRGREVVYQYWPLVQADTPPLLRILQDLKVKRLGIIYSNEEFGGEQQRLLAKMFSEIGGTVALQSFEIADTDLHRQIGALKDQEAIFVATLGASLISAIRQLREAEYGGHILTPATAAYPAMFAMPEMQGVYLVAPIIYNPGYLFAREAGEKFTARYQKPFNLWAANGYDFIKLISGLLEDRPLSRQGVREVLAAGFEYSGVFGHIRVRPGEHVFAFPIFPTQILGGALKYR